MSLNKKTKPQLLEIIEAFQIENPDFSILLTDLAEAKKINEKLVEDLAEAKKSNEKLQERVALSVVEEEQSDDSGSVYLESGIL